MRSNRAYQLVGALALNLLLAACSSQPTAQPTPDTLTVLQNIPPADPTKYVDLRQKKSWRNPYLVVRGDTVGLLSGVTANQEQLLKPEEVLDTLAHLPPSAWPLGRVAAILVQEAPAGSEQQRIALRRNRGVVAGELERAHVAIVWMAAP